MTFPATPLNLVVELFIDGVWTNITDDVYVRDGATVTRGKTDESSQTPPSTCTLTVNNRLGKYSPRNPHGVYYGKIGRNTQVRVTAEERERFYGEISAWPARWDTSGADAHVLLEAAGVLRRVLTGTEPVSTALKSYLLGTSPITYWPLDDGEGSTTGAAAAGTYMNYPWSKTAPVVCTYGTGVLGSHLAPGLRINDTNTSTGVGTFYGYCFGSDTTPDALCWEFVYKTDPAIAAGVSMSAWSVEPRVTASSGSIDIWKIQFRPDANDDIRLTVILDSESDTPTTVNLADSAPLAALTDGELHHVRLHLAQDGADVDYTVYVDGVSVISGTRASHTLRASRSVDVLYDRQVGDDMMVLGHLIVWENAANIPPIATTSGLAHGFSGETAAARFLRLCDEAGVDGQASGVVADSMPMGLQYEDYFSNQLLEIEATDRGLLFESRSSFSLRYRTRANLYNQAPQATLDYLAGDLAPPFEPIEDDQGIRNDVFAQRREGSSYRATLGTGPLSVQDPPNGVGRYKDEIQVNIETDDMLPPIAGWLLSLGTVDEARYPRVAVDIAKLHITNPDLAFSLITNVDIGWPIAITGAADTFIYDDVKLLVLGYTDTFDAYGWRIVFNCVPYSPYEVGELNLADTRLDPGTSTTLAEDLTTTETGADVTVAGPLWSTSGGDYPLSIMIGGEEMTVIAVSGASSPQTFTVTRSVNGVVKTHLTGAAVTLKRPAILAL